MSKEKKKLTHQFLVDALIYNKETGEFYWRNPPGLKVKASDKAGYPVKSGYIKIGLLGRKYYAHRLAWFYYYKYWPKLVDHINRNKNDNRIDNLRECNHSINGHNTNPKNCINNKIWNNGIKYNNQTCKWEARIRINNEDIWLGSFISRANAEFCRNNKKVQIYGQ